MYPLLQGKIKTRLDSKQLLTDMCVYRIGVVTDWQTLIPAFTENNGKIDYQTD